MYHNKYEDTRSRLVLALLQVLSAESFAGDDADDMRSIAELHMGLSSWFRGWSDCVAHSRGYDLDA